jgi:hypothetical protein
VAKPNVELASLIARVATMQSLTLSSNDALTVQPGNKAVGPTTQTPSLLQIENLSQSFTVSYFVSDGIDPKSGSIAVGSQPFQWVKNFNGATLTIANVSVTDAPMQVTLI